MALPDGVKIRTARRGDKDAVYRLLAETGVVVPSAEQSSTLSWIVSHPETEVLLATDAYERGLGMLSLSHRPSLVTGGRLASVESLVVLPSMRGKGIGTELLERALARARMLGCKEVEVSATTEAGHQFLAKRGFAVVGTVHSAWRVGIAR